MIKRLLRNLRRVKSRSDFLIGVGVKKVIEEIIGWYGAIVIVVAYALMSFGMILSNGLLYQTLNCSGALGVVYISFKKKAYQPGFLNILWAIIALIAILTLLF